MAENELLRLKLVEVERLFDLYDHRIELNLNERVTILHGPNGVGKTAVLGMVNALLRTDLSYFKNIPFQHFLLGFHDGSMLELRADDEARNDEGGYKLTLTRNGEVESTSVEPRSRVESVVAQIDHLRPHESIPDVWEDIRDGELLRSAEVLARYADDETDISLHLESGQDWLNVFLKKANTHLIEAQRLVRTHSDRRRMFRRRRRNDRFSGISVVDEYSSDFKMLLDTTMARYGRQSQTLDQSFPQRLISATDELTSEELQDRMIALDQKTADFKALGILDETPTHPFDVTSLGGIDRTESRVMTLYVSDTEEKLKELDDLADRVRLLFQNVNEKYRHKKIRMDRERGLVAENDLERPLPLTSLSSGEQHELVLHYDLLFKVPSNTIVLIDEPELSLHVAWQKNFLPELLGIVRLSNFDALVATHSPFVIGDRDDLMVGLGDTA